MPTSRSSRTCSPRPPIPANEAPPGSSILILYTSGSTSRGSIRMMVSVVISSDTRVPALSFDTGNAGRYDTTYRGPEDAFTITKNAHTVIMSAQG
jgi:hypothetical protein